MRKNKNMMEYSIVNKGIWKRINHSTKICTKLPWDDLVKPVGASKCYVNGT